MRIFITGATGFIGIHLSKLLVNNGHEVTALLRTESKKELLPPEVDIIKGDLSLFEKEDLELPPFDVVVHLAGVIFASDDAGYMKYNYTAVKELIWCLQRQNWKLKRFVFASSLAAAGPSGRDKILTEQDIPNPVDPYGRAKLAAEEFLSTVSSFPTTSFRPAIVLGPGDENSLTLFQMAKNRVGMSVDGKPQYISFVDVDDLNEAIVKMISDTSLVHKKYFVAHPDKISNKEIFKTLGVVMDRNVFIAPLPKPFLFAAMKVSTFVSDLVGIKNQLDIKQYNQLINHFVCSGEALSKDLGWVAQNDLHTTLHKAYLGYMEEGKL